MQKRVNPVRRLLRVRKPRRADVLPSKLDKLNLEAPEGRYKVDSLTSELQARGWLVPKKDDEKHSQPYQIIRAVVNFSGSMALLASRSEYDLPRNKKIAESYFETLRDVRGLIRSIQGIDPNDIAPVLYNHRRTVEDWPGQEYQEVIDATESLMSSLENSSRLVEHYLEKFSVLKLRGANEDRLGSSFVIYMAGMGRRQMKDGTPPRLENSDVKLFSALLDAAWTDLKFPLTNQNGKSLEPLDLYFEVRLKSMFKAKRL